MSHLKKRFKRLRELVWSDPAATEIISVVAAVSWSLAILMGSTLPGNLANYKAMTSVAPIATWVVGFIALGAVQGVALMRDRPKCRAQASMAGAVIWCMTAGLLFVSEPWKPGPVIYGVIGFACAWAYAQNLRAARD